MTERTKLDDLQLALDVAGLEPTIGTAADATNTVISLLRAARDKESDERKKHLLDAGISAVSMIPFADVVKLLKVRKLRKPAVKAARAIKTGAKDVPKSYDHPMEEGWFKDAGKWMKKTAKKTFGRQPTRRTPGVYQPKTRLSAVEKDPYNSAKWVQKLQAKTNRTPQEDAALQQFTIQAQITNTLAQIRDLDNQKRTNPSGWTQPKQDLLRQLYLYYEQQLQQLERIRVPQDPRKGVQPTAAQASLTRAQPGVIPTAQQSRNKWAQIRPGGQQQQQKESITKEELMTAIKEIVEEELGEGVGYVHAKDRAKDPKSIKKPGGGTEHWRIKFQSASDLKKHGTTEKSPVKNETISKKEFGEILKEVINEMWVGWQENKGNQDYQTFVNSYVGTKCPNCRHFHKGGEGKLKVLNPNNPIVYQCNKCGHKWNPDNVKSTVTKVGDKSVLKEFDKVFADRDTTEKCRKCGEEYQMTGEKNPFGLCPDCANQGAAADAEHRRDFQGIDEGHNWDPQVLPKNPEAIAQLIFKLKEGDDIWFSFDKEGRSQHGYGVECVAEGDELVYRTTPGSGRRQPRHYLETEEDINQYAKEAAADQYLHYYSYGQAHSSDGQPYKKQPYQGDPDHDIGDYEKYGPDAPEPQI